MGCPCSLHVIQLGDQSIDWASPGRSRSCRRSGKPADRPFTWSWQRKFRFPTIRAAASVASCDGHASAVGWLREFSRWCSRAAAYLAGVKTRSSATAFGRSGCSMPPTTTGVAVWKSCHRRQLPRTRIGHRSVRDIACAQRASCPTPTMSVVPHRLAPGLITISAGPEPSSHPNPGSRGASRVRAGTAGAQSASGWIEVAGRSAAISQGKIDLEPPGRLRHGDGRPRRAQRP